MKTGAASRIKILEAFFRHTVTPLVILDREFNFLMVNEAYAKACQRKVSDFEGHNHFEFYPSDAKSIFEKVVATKEPYLAIARPFVFHDHPEWGVTYWDWTLVPIIDELDEVEYLVFSLVDVTERKKTEENLLKAQKIESIGVLAGGIAHDFNNLLTGILANVSLARLYSKPNEKTYDLLMQAEKATLRAKDLTQQLLTFSKGGVPVKKTSEIGELLMDSTAFTLSGSKSNAYFNIPDDLLLVDIDAGQINQVINNIVLNAAQAMPDGGTIKVSAENVSVAPGHEGGLLTEGPYVLIRIEDRGVGIPDDIKSKVFDPYFTTKEQGNGLGLATAYSIIKKHGGFMDFESVACAGTAFKIYLPASKEKPPEIRREHKEVKGVLGRVLVMDDEELITNAVKMVLSSAGYEVATAADGVAALQLYQEAMSLNRPFDVVLMDLTIPGGMGGKETIKRLLEIDPNVRAIVTSGYSNDPIMCNCGDYGFKGIIPKPFEASGLKEVVKKVISEGRS